MKLNVISFASILLACANLKSLDQGEDIYEEIIRGELQSNIFLEETLVYGHSTKASATPGAKQAFTRTHDVISIYIEIFLW